jgi:hypothetical protein
MVHVIGIVGKIKVLFRVGTGAPLSVFTRLRQVSFEVQDLAAQSGIDEDGRDPLVICSCACHRRGQT